MPADMLEETDSETVMESPESSENGTAAYEIVSVEENAAEESLAEETSPDENPSDETETETETETVEEMEEIQGVTLEVQPGEYLIQILEDLCELGVAGSVEELLELTESVPSEAMDLFLSGKETEHRCLRGEGYIAPGTYLIPDSMAADEVVGMLLDSWLTTLNADQLSRMTEEAKEMGFTMDDVLVMASIIEYESSQDPYDTVKPQVSAVIHNRLNEPMGLEMDVTVFYLQEALEPYLDPDDYEAYYDTYETDSLPAGPIGSPSVESIEAALHPADLAAFYFVYDKEGNYYFSEDYETHLMYCDMYLD